MKQLKRYRKPALITAVFLQIFVLAFMIYGRESLLRDGKTIRLACQPIDPRSLFSGDYVILNYKISRLNLKDIVSLDDELNQNYARHDFVFIGLEKAVNDDIWQAKAISKNQRTISALYTDVIRGRVQNTYSGSINVKYGIESYFVPQFEGLEIEKNLTNVEVEVAVAASGESAIKSLFIEDREVIFH